MAQQFPTQSEKRGFKAQLLKDKIDYYQLEIFHKIFSREPATLYNELKRNENKLVKIKLEDDQRKLIFPASGQTDSSKFDTTLTAKLIKKLCGYTNHSTNRMGQRT